MWTVYLIYQFHAPLSPLSPRCAILYTRLFSLFFSRRILFFHPEESERLQGRPPYAAASPGAKLAKNRRCFVLSLEVILYTGSFLRDGRRRLPLPPPFGADPKAVFLQKVRSSSLFGLQVPPEALPPLDSPPELRPPPLYTARPICWLTFPLGSDTISIKHRKGRPAPWPSS